MPEADPPPFFLFVADYDRRFFSVEGPMTDDSPWHADARRARDQRRNVVGGARRPNRDALAAEFGGTVNMARVPPGSIVRPRG
jgi:hypothetical protein